MNSSNTFLTRFSSKKTLSVTAIIIAVILIAATAVVVIAGNVAKSFENDVDTYVKRSAQSLSPESQDFKDKAKIEQLTSSAPSLAWIPLGGLNPEYRNAQQKRDALDFYAVKTTDQITGQQDPTYRNEVVEVAKSMMTKYNADLAAYNKSLSGATTIESAKKQDAEYYQKQIDSLQSSKEKIAGLPAGAFAKPHQTFALFHIDKAIDTFKARKSAIEAADDFGIYNRMKVSSQFESERESYYLYRIESLAKDIYFYSVREQLQQEIEAHLGDKKFEGSRDSVQAAAEISYDMNLYKTFIPKDLSAKYFDSDSMLAKYYAFSAKNKLESSSIPQPLQKKLAQDVDKVYADSLTIAFDTKTSNRLLSISGVFDRMVDGLGKIDAMTSDGTKIDETKKATQALLSYYPETDYYAETTTDMRKQVTECVDLRISVVSLQSKGTQLRKELADLIPKKNTADVTAKVSEIRTNDKQGSEAKEKAAACFAKIDPILKRYADLQNAYGDYRASLVNHADAVVSKL